MLTVGGKRNKIHGTNAPGARFLLGLLGMLSHGCSAHIVPSELIGSYSVQYPFGRASLRLSSNGQYEQVLEIGGRTASAKGEWRYHEEGGPGIFLEHCLAATNGFGELKQRWETPSDITCGPSVERRFLLFGAIEIADDLEYSYRKVSPSATANASPTS